MVELWNAGFILKKIQEGEEEGEVEEERGKEGGRRRKGGRRKRRQSLVILDELGRGTATYDGMAIAEATLKYLVKKVGCPVVFVTHYPQLGEVGRQAGRDGGTWIH